MIRCLHGAIGMAEDWEALNPEFHGVDLWPYLSEGSLSLREAGERVSEEASDGDALVGYSMGGRIALHALIFGQRRWKEAVIISAHPGLTTGHEERLAADERWAHLAETDWDGFLKQWNEQPVLVGAEPSWGDRSLLRERRREIAQSFRCWSLGAQEDLRPFLAEITCPVRWLVGERDERFTRLAEEVIGFIPQGRLEIIPDAGHRVPWEQPDAL